MKKILHGHLAAYLSVERAGGDAILEIFHDPDRWAPFKRITLDRETATWLANELADKETP